MTLGKVGRLALALVTGALASSVAARAEWQVSAAAGSSWTKRSDLRITQANTDFTIDGMKWNGEPFEMPPWYEVRATHYARRHPALGFTFGLLHMKVLGDTLEGRHIHGTINGTPVDTTATVYDYVGKYHVSHGVNFIELGVMGRLRWQRDARYPNGRIQPYLGLLAGPVFNHPENDVLGKEHEGPYSWNPRWGSQALVGVQYALSPRWALFSEAKLTHVVDKVPTAAGHGETTLNTAHVSAGITYSWGA